MKQYVTSPMLVATFCSLLLSALPAWATESACSLQLNDDLFISQHEVQLVRTDQTLWRIRNDGTLWINDASVSTDAQTRHHLQQYQAGLRQSAADTVALVTDATALASTAITRVTSHFGINNTEQQQRIDAALKKMQSSIDQVVLQQDGNIRIYGSKLNHLDQGFSDELSAAVEASMREVAGNVLVMVGQALASNDGSFAQRMANFEQDMQQFGETLEAELDHKAGSLEQRGQQICSQLRALDTLEQQIQAQVPAMAAHDLINNSGNRQNALTLRF